jgi:hypothetical protein
VIRYQGNVFSPAAVSGLRKDSVVNVTAGHSGYDQNALVAAMTGGLRRRSSVRDVSAEARGVKPRANGLRDLFLRHARHAS